jgi:hypothetical protein
MLATPRRENSLIRSSHVNVEGSFDCVAVRFAHGNSAQDDNALGFPRNSVQGTRNSHSRHFHARQPPRKAGFAHLLEHLLHLGVLAEKIIHFLDGRA